MGPSRTSIVPWLCLGLVGCWGATACARADGEPPTVVTEALVLERSGPAAPGRAVVQVDPVLGELVDGRFRPPNAGDVVAWPGGPPRTWREAKAGDDGWFRGRGFTGGHSFAAVESAKGRVVILELVGHSAAWVNSVPHAGDPYSYGYFKVPVKWNPGSNSLLIRNGRGRLRVAYAEPRAAAQIEAADSTLPDLVAGREADARGAVVVLNATEGPLEGLALRARVGAGPTTSTPLPPLLPLSSRKVGFTFRVDSPGPEGEVDLALALERDEATIDTAGVKLRVRNPDQARKETFVSSIDGSVQYYGLVPAASTGGPDAGRPGLILTLHGASVEGIGQAAVYSPKPWAHVVAPTNRRPYGFDWEDWGRLDAIEVLELAQARLETDPRRTWLTGHSMGGHGTWHLGVTFPGRFAAIAPSAGWVSMASYAGARPVEGGSPVAELMGRASLPSDTLALAPNLKGVGVYVLHGSADDNVPVGQARQMREKLGAFHPDFAYYERPGAGHWWGNECCDWPPLVEFLRLHELEPIEKVKKIDFATASPGVSAGASWAAIEAQEKPFVLSEVHLASDPASRRISGTTANVRRLAIDLGHLEKSGPAEVVLDGQTVPVQPASDADKRAWLRRVEGRWSAVERPSAGLKGPRRSGPFKEAFRNRFQFVYGTKGTAEENALALGKARLDAERFWYQGNGSVDVVADTAFEADADRDRSVILYGHADSNAAWPVLLGASPARVSRGAIRVGDREIKGDDLACLFVRPRPGSDVASVGVVAGTGPPGLRFTETLGYFTSGVAFPDLVVIRASTLADGPAGLLGAGFFGEDWGVASGEFAWRD